MSDYHDLLDAIARVREATGDDRAWMAGLSADDIAAATSPVSSPAAIAALLAKLRTAHAGILAPGSASAPQPQILGASEGTAADAIRTAETALAQQNSLTAQIDLQVVTAVLNAHTNHTEGAAALDQLQSEIEAAVATRTDLDTAVGAREFQRYLIDKLRDIRTVVETADLDATSKAALAAALASLYASAGSASAEAAPPVANPRPPVEPRPPTTSDTSSAFTPHPRSSAPPGPAAPVDLGLDPPPPSTGDTAYPPADYPPVPTVPSAAAAPPPAPGWGGGAPASAMPFTGGLPTLPAGAFSDLLPGPVNDLPHHDAVDRPDPGAAEPGDDTTDGNVDAPADGVGADDPVRVELPGGQSVIAPSPQLAAVIAAAVAGTPIPDAFGAQGITIPAPGTAVSEPIEPSRLAPGDIGLFTDRHALALGEGNALLDNRIQPVAGMSIFGFLGWQHPPEPVTDAPPTISESGPPGQAVQG